MSETIILTAAPAAGSGRRLSYIVDGTPSEVRAELEAAAEEGIFFTVPDRDNPDAEPSYVNIDSIVSVFAKSEKRS